MGDIEHISNYKETPENFVSSQCAETNEITTNVVCSETPETMTSASASEVTPAQNNEPSRDNHIHDGDQTVQNDLSVGGVLRAKRIIHPWGCVFHSYGELVNEFPSPHPGMWAFVGTTYPYDFYRCIDDGTWSLVEKNSLEYNINQYLSLHKYATEPWVEEQIKKLRIFSEEDLYNYLTLNNYAQKSDIKDFELPEGVASQLWVTQNFITKETFDDLFEKVKLADGRYAIRAKYDLYSDGDITALGRSILPGGSSSGTGVAGMYFGDWTDWSEEYNSYAVSGKSGKALYDLIKNAGGGIDASQLGALTITRNGVAAGVYNPAKASTIDIVVPTKLSELVDDKGYLGRTEAEGLFVKKSGDTMTGALNFGDSNCGIYRAGDVMALKAGDGLDKLVITTDTVRRSLMTPTVYLGSSEARWANVYATTINVTSSALVSNLNADLLDGFHESAFFRANRGGIPTAYIDLTNYGANAEGYANYAPGTYIVARTGHSELFVNLALNSGGSTTALQFLTSYNDYATLRFRKTVDANRVTPWRAILTDYNIGNYNAGSATKWQTARKFWGQSADGTADVDGELFINNFCHISKYGISWNRNNSVGGIFDNTQNGGQINFSKTLDGIEFGTVTSSNSYAIRMLIGVNGNIGIGTTTPSYKLDVNGTARVAALLVNAGLIEWDASKNAFKFNGNLYATGDITALGSTASGGSGSSGGVDTLAQLTDVSLSGLAAGHALVYDGTKWVNRSVASAGLDLSGLAQYLSSNQYLTQPTADGRYVTLATNQEIRSVKTFYGEQRFVFGGGTYADPWQGTVCAMKVTGKIGVTESVKASAFIKSGGTASQFLKADGSVDSNAYVVARPSVSGVNMNQVATYGNSMGMVNLTGTNTAINPNGKTGWHHFINLSYYVESTNMWQTQIANAAGTTDLWVRSRGGSSIVDGTPWVAPWVKILTSGNFASVLNAQYVTALGTNGNYLTWTKNGVVNNITVPYATNADTVDGMHAIRFLYAEGAADFDPATRDGYYVGMTTKSGISTDWWHLLSMNWGDGNTINNKTWASQLALPTQGRNGVYYRSGSSSSAYSPWVKLLDANNYSSLLDSRYVNTAGDTMTGALNFSLDSRLINAIYNSAGNYSNVLYVKRSDAAVIYGSPQWAKVILETSGSCAYRQTSGVMHKIWDAGNDGAGSGLDADMLDGVHLSDIRDSGYAMQQTMIDASSLDANTWYPVVMQIGAHNNVRIEVLVALDSGTKPSWATHNGGFSVRVIWEVNGSGWGTSDVNRTIYAAGYKWAESSPVRGISQMEQSSNEVVYVRGGGKYYFCTSHSVIPVLWTSTYTSNNQSVAPTTTAPAVIGRSNARITDNVASATRLRDTFTLWGQNFYGNNVSGDMTGVGRVEMSGALINRSGAIELYAPTPYIDFHFNNSTADYTSRIIESASGRLAITGKLSLGYVNDSYRLATDSFICNSWVRTVGNTGWYNETYGGGWYMDNTSWVKVYGGKGIYGGSGIIRTDGELQVGNNGNKFRVDCFGNARVNSITIGSVTISYDAAAGGLKIEGNAYTTGDLTALGKLSGN